MTTTLITDQKANDITQDNTEQNIEESFADNAPELVEGVDYIVGHWGEKKYIKDIYSIH